jgi:hypothetical protein
MSVIWVVDAQHRVGIEIGGIEIGGIEIGQRRSPRLIIVGRRKIHLNEAGKPTTILPLNTRQATKTRPTSLLAGFVFALPASGNGKTVSILGEIEAICVHDLYPGFDEIVYKLLLITLFSINFGNCTQL